MLEDVGMWITLGRIFSMNIVFRVIDVSTSDKKVRVSAPFKLIDYLPFEPNYQLPDAVAPVLPKDESTSFGCRCMQGRSIEQGHVRRKRTFRPCDFLNLAMEAFDRVRHVNQLANRWVILDVRLSLTQLFRQEPMTTGYLCSISSKPSSCCSANSFVEA